METVSAPNVWFCLLLVWGWLAALLVLAEWLKRTTNLEGEVLRKVVHIGAGNVIIPAWWLHIPAWISISAAVIASGVAILSYQVPILPSVNSIGRHSWGTFFYAVSIGLLVAIFWPLHQPYYAAIGILVMTWGDGLAALVGQRFGHHAYCLWDMKKSWEGSLAMAIVSIVISGCILSIVQDSLGLSWVIALAIALVATGLEAFSKFGIDNLTVPLGSALTGFWLSQWWGI